MYNKIDFVNDDFATLEYILKKAKMMKAKPTDYIYLEEDLENRRTVYYLLHASNYIRWTDDNEALYLLPLCYRKVFSVALLSNIVNSGRESLKADYRGITIQGYLFDINSPYCFMSMGYGTVNYQSSFMIYQDIMNKINRIKYIYKFQYEKFFSLNYGVISDDEDYIVLKNMRAGDGARPFVRHGYEDTYYVMYMYNGLIPTVKNDIVELNIIDEANGVTFLADFTVYNHKTKSCYHCPILYYNVQSGED